MDQLAATINDLVAFFQMPLYGVALIFGIKYAYKFFGENKRDEGIRGLAFTGFAVILILLLPILVTQFMNRIHY